VRANTIGSDFGFPRLGIKKRYKWKKMNFTTDLPKRNPLVSYIVASAVRCEKFFPGGSKNGPVFRMHAVILKLKPGQTLGVVPANPFNGDKSDRRPLYICCHVRKVEPNDEERDSDVPEQEMLDTAKILKAAQRPVVKQNPTDTDMLAQQRLKQKQAQEQSSHSKRPRRAAAQRQIEYDRDPYIYTGVGLKTGTNLTRRGRRETPQKTIFNKRKSSEATHSQEDLQPGRGKSPSNLFPPINFGARLFSGLGGDNRT
jgi:hypothetical protein